MTDVVDGCCMDRFAVTDVVHDRFDVCANDAVAAADDAADDAWRFCAVVGGDVSEDACGNLFFGAMVDATNAA